MTRTRAFRRHKLETVKKRVVRYCTCPVKDAKTIGQVAQTRKPCSCPMCGNPRKWFGQRTLQEINLEDETP